MHARRFACFSMQSRSAGQKKALKSLIEAERWAACAHCVFESLHEAFNEAVG